METNSSFLYEILNVLPFWDLSAERIKVVLNSDLLKCNSKNEELITVLLIFTHLFLLDNIM